MKKRKPKKPQNPRPAPHRGLYTFLVDLVQGPVTEEFVKKNPLVQRTIQIKGSQSLEDLHWAIYDAYDRDDDHLYQFNFSKDPYGQSGDPCFRSSLECEQGARGNDPNTSNAAKTPIGSLDLKVGQAFWYWFDFGDDWFHRVQLLSVQDAVPPGKYPRVTKRVGESPPQYPDVEDEEWEEDQDEESADDEPPDNDSEDEPEATHVP